MWGRRRKGLRNQAYCGFSPEWLEEGDFRYWNHGGNFLHLGTFGGDGVGGVRKQTFFRRAPSLDHSDANPLNYFLSVRV